MKTVIRNEFTSNISAIAAVDNRILTGKSDGSISLWKYLRPKTLQHIGNYEVFVNTTVRIIIPISPKRGVDIFETNFVVVVYDANRDSFRIILWRMDLGTVEILEGGSVNIINCAVVLPNDLLVVAGNRTLAYECFDVWDLQSRTCIYEGNQYCHRPHGMSLAVTAQGFLVAAGHCSSLIKVWQIDRDECKEIGEGKIDRIYSMAVLPSGEIATCQYDIDFKKISFDEEAGHNKIYQCNKTVSNGNVIDAIFPVSGTKCLVVDRSCCHSGTLKILDYVSGYCDRLGDSVIPEVPDTGIPWDRLSSYHTILEREGVVISAGAGRVLLHEFEKNIFHFPVKFAEIRKNARLLAQAYRTESNVFADIPEEVIFKILMLTCEIENQSEEKLVEQIANNYFSRPSAN